MLPVEPNADTLGCATPAESPVKSATAVRLRAQRFATKCRASVCEALQVSKEWLLTFRITARSLIRRTKVAIGVVVNSRGVYRRGTDDHNDARRIQNA